MAKHYSSVFENEQELLKAVLEIHNNGNLQFTIDPMYNKGKFYKNNIIKEPLIAAELNPEKYGNIIDNNKYQYNDRIVLKGNAMDIKTTLKEANINDSITSIILDPPFMWRKMIKSQYSIADRYTMFETFEELETLYKGIIKSAYETLTKNGLLVFKNQDYTNSKTTMTHVFVHKWLEEQGFYVKDLAILNKKNKPANGNLVQRHLRKTHTYFWIAIKKGGK